jgi:O-antigen/teichoic acid export membrane protein
MGTRLARNSLHSASGRVVAMLAWLVLTPPLVHALGPEGFGVWSLFYALSGWLGAMDLGFSQVALRFGAAARSRDSGTESGEYATLAVVGYLVLGAVWLGLVLLWKDPALDLLRITGGARVLTAQAFVAGAFVFTASGIANTTSAALQAWDRFDLANGVTLTASLAQVAFLAWALVSHAGLTACLTAVSGGWAVAVVAGVLLLARGAPAFRWGSPAAARRRLAAALSYGLPLQAANAMGVAHQQVGKLLIIRMVSLAGVVPYELGLRVTAACFTFAQLALVAVVPEASVLHARDQFAQLEALHRRAGRFVTAAAAVLTASLVAAAPALFTAWLGHADDAAALALRGLAVAAYAAVVGGVSGAIARGAGRTRLELEWSAVALVLHAALGALLIPRMGLAGALVAIAIANVVAGVWFALRLAHALGWRAGRIVWEPYAVPALAVAAGAWAGERASSAVAVPWLALISGGVLAGAVALALLFAFRHVRAEELVSLARRGAAA